MLWTDHILFFLTLLAALGCGLIAGVFFAFSSFVMKALGKLPPPGGIAAMQSINVVVMNPVFLAVFLGTGFVCAIVCAWSLFNWSLPNSRCALAGGLLYLTGTLCVTIFCNVPLNNALERVDPLRAEATKAWADYLKRWTAWNHVRTIASLIATVLIIISLRN